MKGDLKEFFDLGEKFKKELGKQLTLENIEAPVRVRKPKFNPRYYNRQMRKIRRANGY